MLSETEGSHINVLCVFHSASVGNFSSPEEHCPSFVRKADCHSSGFLFVHDLLIGINVITVISLSLFSSVSASLCLLSLYVPMYVRVYVPIHVCVLMACVFTCITPHVIYIYPICLHIQVLELHYLILNHSYPLKILICYLFPFFVYH